MQLGNSLASARKKSGFSQEEVAERLGVSRQTISKWELGKSVPDEASLFLLCQCLEIDLGEKNVLKKYITDKQSLFLIILAIVFSPAVIGIRYCLFKMGKLEDKKFKIMIQGIGFVLFALYFRTLKDNVAYILLFAMCTGYITYQYYLLSLERKDE